MDTASIGGDDHRTLSTPRLCICNEDVNFAGAGIWGSMASWEDAKGTRWVLSPFWGPPHSKFQRSHRVWRGNAWRHCCVQGGGEEWQDRLTPAWMSRDMNRAEPPVIANGVVFAYGSGENTDQAYPDIGLDDVASRRIPASTHAVLYALDAETGKEIVVQRRPDHVVESLDRSLRRKRPCLHRHIRWHFVLLRH